MWYFAQMMMYLDTSQKSPIRYDTIQALKNVSRFDTDPEKVYLDTRYVSNIAILCTTGHEFYQELKPLMRVDLLKSETTEGMQA